VVYEQFALCSLGCGWLGRAALRLKLERSYVETAVPEGGVGGLPGVVEQLDIGATAPKDLSAECIETVVPMLVVGVVWRSSSGGLTSSSSLECPMFAPPIAYMASSLRLW
jgi:hypothetical protein